jgi:hypothetical protein
MSISYGGDVKASGAPEAGGALSEHGAPLKDLATLQEDIERHTKPAT